MHALSSVAGVLGTAAKSEVVSGVAGTAALVGKNAFEYNRENFLHDNEMRFGRYTAGYSMAISQAAMYREDIRNLTELTVSKMDLYHALGVIFIVLNFQLIMAGRLGVHGPAPPGWILGLYWGNVASALMFLCLANWLSMHASARAQAGGAHLLTRKVRLPIPTPKQLDKARKVGNSFERARPVDMFRIPFVAPAPKEGTLEGGGDGKKTRNIPRWHQIDEKAELYGGAGGVMPTPTTVPEHFDLYRNAQREWWAHDAFSRIAFFIFMSNWLSGASLYTQCHCLSELRALWPAWTCSLIFCTAHRAILTIDIIADQLGPGQLFPLPVEKVLPWMPMIACLGHSLDYSILPQTSGWRALIYTLGWFCYVVHVAWAVRFLSLAAPQAPLEEQLEYPGQPWWPSEWHVPPAFKNCLYLIAPQKRLEPGQSCLQLEMKAAKGSKSTNGLTKTTKGKEESPQLWPWFLLRGAIFAYITIWVYISIGRIAEQLHGERYFLKQTGRVIRWPSHMQVWMPPWTRAGSRSEWCHTGGCDRRLSQLDGQQLQAAAEAHRLASILSPLAEGLEQPTLGLPFAQLQGKLQHIQPSWPAHFMPKLLTASSTGLMAALDRSHNGALLRLQPQSSAAGVTMYQGMTPFTLTGVDGLGDLVGASWGSTGILLTSASGVLAECAGMPIEGAWSCQKLSIGLPMGSSGIEMAVAVRVPSTGLLRAAVSFEHDTSISLFHEDDSTATWLPKGEVALPLTSSKMPYFSMSPEADALVVSVGDGGVLKWSFGELEPIVIAGTKAPPTAPGMTWHSVCALNHNHLVHLASVKKGDGVDGVPVLRISTY